MYVGQVIMLCTLNLYNAVCAKSLQQRLFGTICTVAHQVPLSIRFSRQEYWSGLPFPSSGELLDPGIEAASLTSPVLAGSIFTTSITWEAHMVLWLKYISIKLEEKNVKLIKFCI